MATPVQEEAKPEEQNEQLQESQTEEKIENIITSGVGILCNCSMRGFLRPENWTICTDAHVFLCPHMNTLFI